MDPLDPLDPMDPLDPRGSGEKEMAGRPEWPWRSGIPEAMKQVLSYNERGT